MGEQLSGCVILAERHHALIEGIRDLLATAFEQVFIVADETSLMEGAGKLQPGLVVVELSLAAGDLPTFVRRLRKCAPAAKILFLSVHQHPVIARAVAEAGAEGFVGTHAIATDLLPAAEAVMAGRRYLSRAEFRQP